MGIEYLEYYTVEDFEKWEGDWELIRGVPYAMAPFALVSHQRLSLKIAKEFNKNVCKNCEALMKVEVEFSKDTVVSPDVIGICNLKEEKIKRAPEVIFEVVSKGSIKRDELIKFELYEKEAVKYYVIVYPDEKKAKVYELKDYKYVKRGDFFSGKFTFNLSECDVEFDFDEVFN